MTMKVSGTNFSSEFSQSKKRKLLGNSSNRNYFDVLPCSLYVIFAICKINVKFGPYIYTFNTSPNN